MEEEEQKYCNRCGQPISKIEYENTYSGYCDECEAIRYDEEYDEWKKQYLDSDPLE